MWSPMYTPHREDPIYPVTGIKACWHDHELIDHTEDLQPNWLVVLGLFEYAEP